MSIRLATAFVAAALAVAACGGDSGTPADGAQGDGAQDTAAPDYLDFVADDVRGGQPIDASQFAGQDLVLWFWAPW